MVEKSEFIEYMKDWAHFAQVIRTENLPEGENIYNWCVICGYHGSKVAVNIYDLDKLDRKLVEHIWKKHTSFAAQKVLQWRSEKVAGVKGQQRLEI
jgi:hypothetical protein